jgi:uncharacterized cysteine cluster protein YcgN (CxxCxxCC family)
MIECVMNCTATYERNGGILDRKQWYQRVTTKQKKIHESKINILRNQQVHANRPIPYNKPDIVIHGNEKINVC